MLGERWRRFASLGMDVNSLCTFLNVPKRKQKGDAYSGVWTPSDSAGRLNLCLFWAWPTSLVFLIMRYRPPDVHHALIGEGNERAGPSMGAEIQPFDGYAGCLFFPCLLPCLLVWLVGWSVGCRCFACLCFSVLVC